MALDWQNDAEYLALIEDLIDLEEVQCLKNYVHHLVTDRLSHSLSVSYRSYRWAKRFNLNTRAIARAGLLHDLFYYDSADKHQVGGKGHNWEHPRIALQNALKITELSELEQDIIVKHMFGATRELPKYPESYIVTLMDKQAAIFELGVGFYHFCLAQSARQSKKLVSFLL